jgi:transmembrane sensor
MNEPSNHSSHVTPRFNKTRADAQWTRIAERMPRTAHARGPVVQLLGAFAVVCVLGFVWWWSEEREARSVWEGSLVASDDAPVNFTLAEGTLIELEPRSEVELLHSASRSVQLSLRSGSARFDVAKRKTRRFSVRAGEVEVVVTGTTFRVRRAKSSSGERVRVDVEEGSVEVRRGDSHVRLTAGEHWSTFLSSEPAQPSAQLDAPKIDETPTVEAKEPSAPEGQPEVEVAPETAEEDATSAEARPRRKARALAEDAALDLFERANVARRLGQLRDAADAYAELVARFPRDRRAALAAFELGRIRMDSLADPRGAVEALERALKLDGQRAHAEDSLARLVLAEDALGDVKACESARERYLSRYPDGVHAQYLTSRCVQR